MQMTRRRDQTFLLNMKSRLDEKLVLVLVLVVVAAAVAAAAAAAAETVPKIVSHDILHTKQCAAF